MDEQCDLQKHCPVYRMCRGMDATQAGKHFHNAKKELLLALRAVIDREIDRTEDPPRPDTAQKVDIS